MYAVGRAFSRGDGPVNPEQDDPQLVRIFLAKHADVNAIAKDGTTALKIALRLKGQKTAQLLQNAGARD
jgi:hypothetical protein